MKHSLIAVTVAIAGLLCITMAGAGCSRNNKNSITLAGSTAFQPFAEKLAEYYIAANPGTRINVQGGGSAVGVQAALAGSAQIGMADLLTLPDEAKSLTATIVARDGIAIIVHKANVLKGLTAAQARSVFAGEISNWKDLGGPDAPIRIISREEGSGTRKSFQKLVLGDAKLAPNALFQNSNGTIREAVSSNPDAIGYLSIGLVNNQVKAVAFDGVEPVNANVKNGTYPLARPIYFLTAKPLSPEVQVFIDYVMSGSSQKLLEKEGLISAK